MKTGLVRKILKWAAITLAVIFAALQFIRPARTNPTVDESRAIQSHLQMTSQAAAILDRACNDCHSNQTRWPWYSNIAPVSWFLVNHVNVGRTEMNFSDWAQYSRDDQEHLLEKICREVKIGAMPLGSYLWLHGEAKLSPDDVKILCDWANAQSHQLSQTSEGGSQNE